MTKRNTLIDCLTAHIKKTALHAQENVYLFINKEGTITNTLNSMDTCSSAISSSNLIKANASTVFDFWSKNNISSTY